MSDRPTDDPATEPHDAEPSAEELARHRAWQQLAVAHRDDPDARAERATEKCRLLTESLERGKSLVRIDARRAGCRVPEALADECQLALNLSWRFAHTDMVINERGVAATLRFGGTPFRCIVPWSALWGLLPHGDDQLRIWPVDLPEELGGPPAVVDEAEPPPVEPVKPRLAVVSRAEPDAPAVTPERAHEAEPLTPASEPEAPGATAARGSWLRVVK